RRCNLADGVIIGVGDVEVATTVEREALRIEKPRVGAGAIHATGIAGQSGEGGDDAGWGDFADDVVVRIGDEEITRGIEREPARIVEAYAGARAVGVAGRAVAVLGEHRAGGRELVDYG